MYAPSILIFIAKVCETAKYTKTYYFNFANFRLFAVFRNMVNGVFSE